MQASQQISDNPAPTSVTRPTDPTLKAADIERKMKLYGIFTAFRHGKYPSNDQISKTLDYALRHEPVPTRELSKDGKMLVQDFQNIIRTSKSIVEEKNADELFQNFLYHTRSIDTAKINLKDVSTGTTKSELDSEGQQALEHLRTLGKLIFTNSEARKLLKDISLLGRDVAADAAAKVSDVARPSDAQLATADEPAPSNQLRPLPTCSSRTPNPLSQWVGHDGQVRSHNEAVPSTGLAAKRDEAKAKKEEVKASAQEQAEASKSHVAGATEEGQQGQATDQDRVGAAGEQGGQVAKEEKQKVMEKLKGKIPEKHKDEAREQYRLAKEYAKEKFPEERRQRFIYRLKKVVVENQRHRDYQEAIEFFIDRAEHYSIVAEDAAQQGGNQGATVLRDSALQQAETELQTLLERFANGQSMQPIFDAVKQLYRDASKDQELTAWWKDLAEYVRRVLQEPGYVMKDAADADGRALLDQGKRFWDPKEGKYAGHKDAVFDTVQTFFTAYAGDELNVQLGEDVKKLTKDLLMDSEGNYKFKPELWDDVREVILPSIAKNVGYVPIPRIEYTDNMVDVVVENLTLESENLLPNIIEIEARNYFKVSPYKAIKDAHKHSFWVSFSQIQADLKDVAFYIKKKSGFPKITDSGLADVFIGGKGISGKIHVESTGRKDHAFKVIDVKVNIDKLKFAIRENRHSILVATFKPLITGMVKKGVAHAIQEAIRSGLVQLDSQLADISERLEAAKDAEGGSKIDIIKQTLAEKKAEAEKKKEEVTPAGHFQITTSRDSMLVDWSSKDSIVMKQGAKEDQIKTSGWKSSAFDILNNGSTTASHATSSKPSAAHATNGNTLRSPA